jgi:hypothetical protein
LQVQDLLICKMDVYWQVLFECDIQHHEQEAIQLLPISLVSSLASANFNYTSVKLGGEYPLDSRF